MLRIPAVVAACAAVLLVAAACTDDEPEPNFSSVSTSASPTSSPTPSESATNTQNVPSGAVSPTLPPQGASDTSDGAFAFVSHYWKELDWAYSVADGDGLAGLYRASCSSCESSRQSINSVRDKGNVFRGGHIAIKSQMLADVAADPSASYAIDTTLAVDALVEVASSGAEVASYPAATYTVRAFVAWSTDHFEVTATSNVGGS